MARWLLFTADYDHRWPSRAITAFKAGQKLFVKEVVANAAIAKGRAVETQSPKAAKVARETTPERAPVDPTADHGRGDDVARDVRLRPHRRALWRRPLHPAGGER